MVHSTALNSSDNLPSYPPDNHHSSDDVYRRGGDDDCSSFCRMLQSVQWLLLVLLLASAADVLILVWSVSAAIEFVQDIFDAELDEVYGSLIDASQPSEPETEVIILYYITL